MELCQEVLKTLDVLSPGYSTSRGNRVRFLSLTANTFQLNLFTPILSGSILYELQAAEVLLSKHILESGKCSLSLIRKRLQNSLEKLDESINIFELSYPMRMLGEAAKASTRFELISFMKALK